MGARYAVEEGDLLVIEGDEVRWRGRPDGVEVRRVFPLPGEDECVALLDHGTGSGDVQNLVRVNSGGEIRWRAEVPQPGSSDAYVEADWMDEGLTATSWSGYAVVIDPDTGRIRDRRFTK